LYGGDVNSNETQHSDAALMSAAVAAAEGIQRQVSPNPGVGAAIRTSDGQVFVGCTQPPGGAHAEVMAIRAAVQAGASFVGATLATTLEPCNHHGRTGPCTEAILAAKINRVIVGILDPDPQVAGTGIRRLTEAGVSIGVGVGDNEINEQLRYYLHHRRTGRPYVTLKLAMSLDGKAAAPDGSSQWITSEQARTDGHRLRADHDAILVGAGTVRADDPSLTVRHVDGPDPLRVVLGRADSLAKVHPCREMSGALVDVLEQLGADGVLSVLVEGGPTVAAEFHRMGLVNTYVAYLAPVLFGGDDAQSVFRGLGAPSMAELWRGRLHHVETLGPDVKMVLRPLG
jgi:diaminohydroxyphosphoribosylaminopyrimidine deaminase / 5-amino-6-(5-phosphoribosylamino)uracil reductase